MALPTPLSRQNLITPITSGLGSITVIEGQTLSVDTSSFSSTFQNITLKKDCKIDIIYSSYSENLTNIILQENINTRRCVPADAP